MTFMLHKTFQTAFFLNEIFFSYQIVTTAYNISMFVFYYLNITFVTSNGKIVCTCILKRYWTFQNSHWQWQDDCFQPLMFVEKSTRDVFYIYKGVDHFQSGTINIWLTSFLINSFWIDPTPCPSIDPDLPGQ